MADALVQDRDKALDALAREELGLDPDDLGSPWGAAITSFVSFALGAILPLLPFLIAAGQRPLGWVAGVAAIALFGIGSAISLFSGTSALRGGLRMLIVGALAGGATFLIGRAFGIGLS
jgi:VIT1/CCC1 family predicted Fe2+/Mn2+ transporter